jgi:hypothetical protein
LRATYLEQQQGADDTDEDSHKMNGVLVLGNKVTKKKGIPVGDAFNI